MEFMNPFDDDAPVMFRLNVEVRGENKAISFIVDVSWTMADVKAKLEDMEGTAASQQQLFYEGVLVSRNEHCLFDLKAHWGSMDTLLVLEMRISWRSPMSTRERDEARSRSRSPRRDELLWRANFSDLGNENCIF